MKTNPASAVRMRVISPAVDGSTRLGAASSAPPCTTSTPTKHGNRVARVASARVSTTCRTATLPAEVWTMARAETPPGSFGADGARQRVRGGVVDDHRGLRWWGGQRQYTCASRNRGAR